MEYQELMQAIGSVGFPIVACGALFYMINTTLKELSTSLNNMNSVLARIDEKIKEA
ncbi:MAG: hypothetical protein IKF78_00460 [Atopobiaceae bacterium]|nr:hypothetical protein [Atopobiaceae bacterium]